MLTKILERFARWFASATGVWQTALLVAATCVFEIVVPSADQHGFWLLYWLTVYSAVTQPALAYVGSQAGIKTDIILNEELRLIREELTVLRSIAEAVGAE